MNTRNRDDRGRFVSEVKEDVESVANIFWLIYRLLPFFLLIIGFIKYYDLSSFFNDIGESLACGKNCYCACDTDITSTNSKPDF